MFLIGNTSNKVETAGEIHVDEDLIIKKCTNCLQIQECNVEQLRFLSAKSGEKKAEHYDNSRSESCRSEAALKNETAELKDFSIRQLAALCVGYVLEFRLQHLVTLRIQKPYLMSREIR